ncbi:MAG: pentapeptide repeat-containing protein, partial [Anaerolineales bacterium]|nr:pentapeptide repeat-containing protein [Anaerolineales bacterium]
AYLNGANMLSAKLEKTVLVRVNFTGANLCKANMSGADLRNANLRNANLYEANLDGANLRGASLVGSNLGKISMQGATYDESTKWPVNFDPEDYGAKSDG